MPTFGSLFAEWKSRRAGRKAMNTKKTTGPTLSRVTRDVTGPMGNAFSSAWDKLDEHGEAYRKSFDRRIPPSLFVSERDRTRFAQPMPMAERCIEDAALHFPPSVPRQPAVIQSDEP